MPEELRVDPAAHLFERATLHESWHAGRELDHVDPTPHLALPLADRLAVLPDDQLPELVQVLLAELLDPEHQPRALHDGHVAPGLVGGGGGLDGAIDVGRGRERDAGQHFTVRRVEHVEDLVGLDGDAPAADEVLEQLSLVRDCLAHPGAPSFCGLPGMLSLSPAA